MQTVLVVLGIMIIGFIAIVYILTQKMNGLKNDQASSLLKTDITNLTKGVDALKDTLSDKLSDKLDKNQLANSTAIQRQFAQSAKIIADISEKLVKLDETNSKVINVTDELKKLQDTLQNPKQRGVFGEYYLETVLQNVLPPKTFQMQYRFKDGETVDAVIILDKGRLVPIDSKFSLENYNRLLKAKTPEQREDLTKIFKADIKRRIDETARYIRPNENTLDYAFMFIPSEAIYYDLLISGIGGVVSSARDLIEYAFRDKKVIIVSPTTLLAYLQTVLHGLRSLQIEEQAKDIQKRVGQLGAHIATHNIYMHKLGSSLGTTVNHFNAAHKELAKIDKDVVKIADTDSGVEPLLLDKPDDIEE